MGTKNNNSGLFSSERQPKNRATRPFKSRLVDVIQKEAMLLVGPDATRQVAEEAFITHLAERAFDRTDPASSILLKELVSRSYSSVKPAHEPVKFDLDLDASPVDQVKQLLVAASQGLLSPDVAVMFVGVIKAGIEIAEATDMKQRVEHLEAMFVNPGEE